MRIILHVDMDAFYASIEQRDRPELKGRPVIIGSPPDQRGVVSAASYEARVFGVHSAMPSRTAGRLCPDGVFLPVRMSHYAAVSRQLMTLFESYTPLIQPLSLDEAFLDVTGIIRRWPTARDLAQDLKQRVTRDLGLTASVGVAPNMYLAKIASDLEKPDGLTVTPFESDAIERFLAPLPVTRIWGVGKVSAQRLARNQLFTMRDLQAHTPEKLAQVMGSRAAGERLWALCRGIDNRTVEPDTEELSISREHTFDEDCDDMERVRHVLLTLTEDVGRRLRRAGRWTSCVQIKYRYADFETHTRQQQLPRPIRADRELLHHALDLWQALNNTRPIRLIGFGVSKLSSAPEPEQQLDLFAESKIDERNQQLDRTVDSLRERYGPNALRRGIQCDDLD